MKLFEVIFHKAIVKLQHFIFVAVFIFYKALRLLIWYKADAESQFSEKFCKVAAPSFEIFLEIVHVARLVS